MKKCKISPATLARTAALALVRCGVEQLAQAYPGCVEITGS